MSFLIIGEITTTDAARRPSRGAAVRLAPPHPPGARPGARAAPGDPRGPAPGPADAVARRSPRTPGRRDLVGGPPRRAPARRGVPARATGRDEPAPRHRPGPVVRRHPRRGDGAPAEP